MAYEEQQSNNALRVQLAKVERHLVETHGEPPNLDDDWEPEHSIIAEIRMTIEKHGGAVALRVMRGGGR